MNSLDDEEYALRTRLRAMVDAIDVPTRSLGVPGRRSVIARGAALVLLASSLVAAIGSWSLHNGTVEVTPSATGSPGLDQLPFHSDLARLSLRLPPGWTPRDDGRTVNRVTMRLAIMSNGPLDASLLETSANPQGDWTIVPATEVVLELREQSGGPAPQVPPTSVEQSSAPPPWPPATSGHDAAFTVYSTRFAYLWHNFELLAHVGPSASPADRDALARIVTSISFDPPPDRGSFDDGRVFAAGALAGYPVGSVTYYGVSAGGPNQSFYLVRGAVHFFAITDRAYVGFGSRTPCPVRFVSVDRTFVCDATTEHWDMFGVLQAPEHQYDLGWLGVIVRDGRLFVGGAFVAGPRQIDETAEGSR